MLVVRRQGGNSFGIVKAVGCGHCHQSRRLVYESKQLLSPLLAAKQQAVLCNDSPSSCQKGSGSVSVQSGVQ